MTKRKSTKRALLLSALSLLMCVSMLIGSTFAWFTDSVTSGQNTIQSGNLDVELYYTYKADVAADKDSKDWVKVTKNTDVFGYDLWEPGYTKVAYFMIKNEGSLELKYQLAADVYTEDDGTNQDGDKFLLSDYIMTDLVNVGATRDEILAKAGTPLKNSYSMSKGSLAAGASEVVGLAIWMPTTVGNVANHDGKDIPEITFGINLLATQKNAESDSFGSDYDKDAWDKAMKVYSEADLDAAFKNVEDGGLIVIAEDLTLEKGVNSGSTYYEGYYYNGDKSFTIDLNGNTLTNSAAINDYLLLFKNEGEKENTITIKNGTLEAASSAYCAVCTSTTSTQKITINLENVKVIGNNSNGSVIKVRGGAELNVKAGTTITGKNSYLGIENWQATVNIYDGAEIYQNGTSSYNGCLVGVGGGDKAVVNVYGGYGKGVSGGFIAMTSGGTINVHGGEWIANTNGAYANGNKSVLVAQSENHAKSIVNVYGGTFKGGFNCYGAAAGDAQINISGGNFNADPASYVAAGYKAVEVNGSWMVMSNDLNYVADGVLISTDGKAYSITNETGLVWVEAQTDAFFAGKTVKLTADVDCSDVEIKSIKFWSPENKTTFDGQGHTIYNLDITANAGSDNQALFNGTVDIKNVTIDGAQVKGNGRVGALGGTVYGNITNCHVKNSTIISTYWQVGGLVGLHNFGDVIGCSAENVKVSAPSAAGALIGLTNESGNRKFENCSVKDCVIAMNGGFGGVYDQLFGAITGGLNVDGTSFTFNNCTVEGTTVKGVATDAATDYSLTDSKVYVDGIWQVSSPVENAQPTPYVGECYKEGTNVVAYKNMVLTGNAYISIDNNASVAIENVTADVENSVVVMKDFQPAIYISGGNFTIEEGEFLVDASAINGGVGQIFLVDVMVNGEYLTQETAAQYLNNVYWFGAYQSN